MGQGNTEAHPSSTHPARHDKVRTVRTPRRDPSDPPPNADNPTVPRPRRGDTVAARVSTTRHRRVSRPVETLTPPQDAGDVTSETRALLRTRTYLTTGTDGTPDQSDNRGPPDLHPGRRHFPLRPANGARRHTRRHRVHVRVSCRASGQEGCPRSHSCALVTSLGRTANPERRPVGLGGKDADTTPHESGPHCSLRSE